MLKVKSTFIWKRSFSAIPDGIEVKAGAIVENTKNGLFVSPRYFLEEYKDSILYHDAEYHGCHVLADNVIDV